MKKTKIAIFISGRGSNMQALIRAVREPDFPAQVSLVISNRTDAPGLYYAQSASIPSQVVASRDYRGDRVAHEKPIYDLLVRHNIQIICLAGYKRLFSPWFTTKWNDRMLNIHPSLLPSFPGLQTHARALAAGVKLHGCTVHLVTEEMDSGPILGQAAIPVLRDDTENTLAEKVLALEHKLYPTVLKHYLLGIPSCSDFPSLMCG